MHLARNLRALSNLSRRPKFDPESGADYADELLSAVHSLRAAGLSRRGISELLRINEQQVRQLLEQPR